MKPAIPPVNVIVEGITDEAVACRLIEYVGLTCGTMYGKNGRNYILKRLSKYNQAARFTPWLVVVDLENEPDCVPDFVRRVLPNPADGIRFRVAVRAIEAWLMADAERLAAFLSIPVTRIPSNPDGEPEPKTTLINLARQSRRKAIREDIVPRQGSGSRVGPGYSSRIIEFVKVTKNPWRPEIAITRSDSLRSCMEALQSLKGCEQRIIH
ncbi:hypothetical protein H8E77_26855 [bacterium]|nr:hypothetical protein [bacterium]